MKFLLTGATGMVGSHLAKALVHRFGKDSVVALTRAALAGRCSERDRRLDSLGVRRIHIDLEVADGSIPELPEFDVVYHLAANLRTDIRDDRPGSPMHVNDRGTHRLIEFLGDRLKGKLFVYTSSIAVVDPATARWDPVDETTPCTPRTLYGRTKLRGEEFVRGAAVRTGFPYVVFRLGTVYGTHCREGHIFDRFTQWARAGALPGRILWPGLISLVYIDDLVDVLMGAAEHDELRNDTFFIANSEKVTVGQWAAIIAAALGREPGSIALPAWVCAALRGVVFRSWFWDRMPETLALAAWRLSLILSNGFFCDNAKLQRVFPKEYIDVREGVRRTFAAAAREMSGAAA